MRRRWYLYELLRAVAVATVWLVADLVVSSASLATAFGRGLVAGIGWFVLAFVHHKVSDRRDPPRGS